MTKHREMSRKTIAWNHVSFTAPAGWIPAVLEKDYMRFDDAGCPKMALRWNRIKGRFNIDRHLKKLARNFKRSGKMLAAPGALFPGWDDTLAQLDRTGIRAAPFAWCNASPTASSSSPVEPTGAVGAVLYCKKTATAAMVQCYLSSGSGGDRTPRNMLPASGAVSSIRFHDSSEKTAWSVFDIKFRIPGGFEIKRFAFNPGHFRLIFGRGGRRLDANITLDRLAPADVLLRSTSLEQFAGRFYSDLGLDADTFFTGNDTRVEGQRFKQTRLPGLPSRKLGNIRGRMWRLNGRNKVMGGVMRCFNKNDLTIFDEICADYDIIETL